MQRAFLVSIYMTFFVASFCQDIATDSKSKGVSTYYSTKKYRLDFSSKDFSFTYSTNPTAIRYVQDQVNTTDTNVKKQSNFYIQPALVNATDIISLSNFSKFRPGFRLRLGYQRVVDTIYSVYSGSTFSAGANIFAGIDNMKLFDTETNKEGRRHPFVGGVEGNFTWYTPKRWLAVALNASLSRGYNDNTLLNYKMLSGSVTTNELVAFEKFDGKYGRLNRHMNKLRFSLSIPITAWYINPIPYFVGLWNSGDGPSYFAGIYTNILSEKVNFSTFKLPSTLGIGFDWINKDGRWSNINVFIRGNLSFGKFQ